MTAIEWTTIVWNPVTGCTRVSPGCANCYMFRQYPWLRGMNVPGYDKEPDTVQLVEDRLEHPRKWARRKPMMVFVNSMSDMFHEDVPFDYIERLFAEMEGVPQHVFQILTKRPERAAMFWRWRRRHSPEWPANVWMGVSVESQEYAGRIGVIESIPAAVRFVSAEPLLAEVSLKTYLERSAVKWVIAGGESGRGARPMNLDWARVLRDECDEYGVAFFLKQLGGQKDKRGGERAVLDGRRHLEWPEAAGAAGAAI